MAPKGSFNTGAAIACCGVVGFVLMLCVAGASGGGVDISKWAAACFGIIMTGCFTACGCKDMAEGAQEGIDALDDM